MRSASRGAKASAACPDRAPEWFTALGRRAWIRGGGRCDNRVTPSGIVALVARGPARARAPKSPKSRVDPLLHHGPAMRGIWLGLGSLCVGAVLASPQDAEACGGTFCDGGPQGPMSSPVDQTGENILFVIDEGSVEAHIQIQYDPNTDAEKFAWIVPVMAVPEFEVGSQALFLNLLNGTVPAYGYNTNFESCGGGGDDWGGDWDGCDGTGGDGNAGGDEGGFDDGGSDGGTSAGGTEVVAEATVGAFDIVVLQSTTTAELMQWLTDNEYFADPAAEPILGEYLAEGFLFAAFRLTQGAEVGEIHPIVIRYEGDEPCVPIRLTRIAAQDDMEIRTFFLGEARVAPTNYKHVELNPLKLDWMGLGANYPEAVSMAVDSPGADGHAFVTEYAGSSVIVSPDGIFDPAWSSIPIQSAEPLTVIDLLAAQGLVSCEADACTWGHPLMQGILAAYLPVPDGLVEAEFYSCVECYEGLVDMEAWDALGLADAIATRIISPAQHAVQLLADNPYLTRLYTTISPHEMTEDPFFHENDMLGDVDHTADIALLTNECSGNQRMDLLDLRRVELAAFNVWPDIAPAEMPWAERIEQIPTKGAPIVEVDNAVLIDTLLAAWNAGTDVDVRPEARCHDGDVDSDTDGGPVSGGSWGDTGDGPGQDIVEDGGLFGPGCGCRSTGGGGAGWLLTVAALGAGFVTRRRRR
jgi:MYXO-CTERM domain-containing protein